MSRKVVCVFVFLMLFPTLFVVADSIAGQAAPLGGSDLAWEWTGGPRGAVTWSFAATSSGALLVGTEAGGLYRSADGGLWWDLSELGLTWPCCNYSVPSLCAASSVVYAGTWGGGVFRSDDDGVSWSATSPIPDEPYPIVLGLAACRYGERVYACGNFGVARSEDGGASWELVTSGLPASWVRGVALRGTDLYARLDDGTYRLNPDDATWYAANDGLPGTSGQRSLRATADALFLTIHQQGVFHLDCADSAWVALNDGVETENVEVLVEADRSLYAGLMGGGVRQWDPFLAYWETVNDGLWNGDIRSMEKKGRVPYAGTYGAGVFELDVDTGTWALRSDGLHAPLMTALVANDADIYAGLGGGGIYRSVDQGDTWVLSISGLDEAWIHELVADGGDIFAGTWNGVRKSSDDGGSWSTGGLQGKGVFGLLASSGILYAGTYDGRVWSSPDAGGSWTEVGTGLPSASVESLARLGTVLYSGLRGGGVYALPDGMTTWSAMNTGLPDLNVIALAIHGGEIFAGLDGNGVYRWNSVTEEWDAAGLESRVIFCLADMGAQLLAGTWGELYGTTDGGQIWTNQDSGLKEWLAVRAIAVGENHVFVGLDGGGVWRSSYPVAVAEQEAVTGIGLSVNPNPFSRSAAVLFTLDRPLAVRLGVFDAAGRQMASLADGLLPAGTYERSWTGTDSHGERVAAGVYFVRFEAGGTKVSTKTIRLH